MNKANAPLLIALATVLAASACLATLPAPVSVPSTFTPDLAMTGKAQTLTAVPTATLTAIPVSATDTPTITLTPFPSITPLPSATSSPTKTPFGYFETPTPTPISATVQPTTETPDPVEGATNEHGAYTCKLVTKSPPDWTVLPARNLYKVSWTLYNTGPKTWDSSIVIVWVDGNRLGVQKQYNFSNDVKVGRDADAVITIFTPNQPGHYRSVWGLRSLKTNLIFCTFTIKIVIQ